MNQRYEVDTRMATPSPVSITLCQDISIGSAIPFPWESSNLNESRVVTPTPRSRLCILEQKSLKPFVMPLKVTVIRENHRQIQKTLVSLESIFGCTCLANCLTQRAFPALNLQVVHQYSSCRAQPIGAIPESLQQQLSGTALAYAYHLN